MYDSRLVKFRHLPRQAQWALIHYLALDGTAWPRAKGMNEALADLEKRYKPNDPGRHNEWACLLPSFLPYYLVNFADTEWGYIPEVATRVIIAAMNEDEDLRQREQDFQEYHHEFMLDEHIKHTAPSNHWPVLLSSRPEYTLADGITRFHQYVERKLVAIPVLFSPRLSRQDA